MDEKFRHWFTREHSKGDLRSKSIKGGASTIFAQLISFALNIGSTVLLARLLLPEDYGLVAMVTSFTGFVLMFKDLGLTQAVIQREEINHNEVSMVFWVNVYVSLALALVVIATGPILVWFYNEPRLMLISFAYALVAILGGLSAQHSALLNRQMKFQILSRITIISSLLSLLVGLLLAYLGYGYWAVVAISVVSTFVQAVLLWFFCSWRPSFKRITKEVKSYLQFGAGVTGFNMVNYFSRNLDNILIGKFIGAGPLGLYSKAYQLLMLPISQLRDPLNAVGTPALSSLVKDPDKYRKYYNEYVFLLSFFSMPIVVFLFVCAHPLILLILGENWASAAEIFQLLAITALIQPIASTRGMVMLTSGLSTRYFWWGVYNAIAVIIAFSVGVRWGISGIAIAYAIANYVILFPSLQYCFKSTPVSVAQFFKSAGFPFIFSVIAGTGTYFAYNLCSQMELFWQVLLPLLVFGFLYIVLWIPIMPTRKRLMGVVDIAKSIMAKKK